MVYDELNIASVLVMKIWLLLEEEFELFGQDPWFLD